jgi:hypothetical protein
MFLDLYQGRELFFEKKYLNGFLKGGKNNDGGVKANISKVSRDQEINKRQSNKDEANYEEFAKKLVIKNNISFIFPLESLTPRNLSFFHQLSSLCRYPGTATVG